MTRKTWRYMADAGKLLIPDALRKAGFERKRCFSSDQNSKIKNQLSGVEGYMSYYENTL